MKCQSERVYLLPFKKRHPYSVFGGKSQHRGDEYVKYLKANDTTGVQDRHWEAVQWCKI